MKQHFASFCLLVAAAACPAATLVDAQPYVFLRRVPVYESPDPAAKITTDLAPDSVSTLWGIAVEGGTWIKVMGGAERGIDPRRATQRTCTRRVYQPSADGAKLAEHSAPPSELKLLAVENGRLVVRAPKKGCDSLTGYVRREHLLEPKDLPRHPVSVNLNAVGRPVPALWKRIGVDDNRYWITRADEHPFSAIAAVTADFADQPSISCTGFFVRQDVVVTAKHCVVSAKDSKASQIVVIMARSRNSKDVIAAQVVAQGEGPQRNDWAILKTARPSTVPVEPLQVVQQLPPNAGLLDALLVGFPGDLEVLSLAQMGYKAPVASRCELSITQIRAPIKNYHAVFVEPDPDKCILWYGNSGGPLLIWNRERRKFEVAGIAESRALPWDAPATKEDEQLAARRSTRNSQVKADIESLLRSTATDVRAEFQAKHPALANAYPSASDGATLMASTKFAGVAAVDAMMAGTESDGYLYSRRLHERFELTGDFVEQLGRVLGSPATPPVQGILATNKFLAEQGKPPSVRFDALRSQCVKTCVPLREFADLQYQFDRSVGDPVSAAEMDRYVNSKHAMVYLQRDTSVILVGGDMIAVDNASQRVVSIRRDAWLDKGRVSRVFRDRIPFAFNEIAETGPPPEAAPAMRSLEKGLATPKSVAGATIIRSWPLLEKLFGNEAHGKRAAIVSVASAPFGIPGALMLPLAGESGAFEDEASKRLGELLLRETVGAKSAAVVIYGENGNDWRSYNAVLRAIKLGYGNVIWYRWGLAGWRSLFRCRLFARSRNRALGLKSPAPG